MSRHYNLAKDSTFHSDIRNVIYPRGRRERTSIISNGPHKSCNLPLSKKQTNQPLLIYNELSNLENIPPKAIQITLKSPLTLTQNNSQDTKSNNTG